MRSRSITEVKKAGRQSQLRAPTTPFASLSHALLLPRTDGQSLGRNTPIDNEFFLLESYKEQRLTANLKLAYLLQHFGNVQNVFI